MHSYGSKNQNKFGTSRGIDVLKDLPDLPPIKQEGWARQHNVWLRRVAVCFVLISLLMMARAAFVHLGAP
jgi:hypothetical protein